MLNICLALKIAGLGSFSWWWLLPAGAWDLTWGVLRMREIAIARLEMRISSLEKVAGLS